MKQLMTDNLTGVTKEVNISDIEMYIVEVPPDPTIEERISALESALLYVILGGAL